MAQSVDDGVGTAPSADLRVEIDKVPLHRKVQPHFGRRAQEAAIRHAVSAVTPRSPLVISFKRVVVIRMRVAASA